MTSVDEVECMYHQVGPAIDGPENAKLNTESSGPGIETSSRLTEVLFIQFLR